MPYKLKKARNKPLYWVIDNTGKKYEKDPIPLERAKKQLVALHINTKHGGAAALGNDNDAMMNGILLFLRSLMIPIQKAYISFIIGRKDSSGNIITATTAYKYLNTILDLTKPFARTGDNSIDYYAKKVRDSAEQYTAELLNWQHGTHIVTSTGERIIKPPVPILAENAAAHIPVPANPDGTPGPVDANLIKSKTAAAAAAAIAYDTSPAGIAYNQSVIYETARQEKLKSDAAEIEKLKYAQRLKNGANPRTKADDDAVALLTENLAKISVDDFLLAKAGGSIWGSVIDTVNKIPGWTTALVSNKYTKATQNWITKNKTNTIETLTVRRAPIAKGLNTAFDLITAGQWSPGVKAAGYDNMYHLSIVIINQNGKPSQLEKLSNLNYTDSVVEQPNTEYRKIPVPAGLNIGNMLAKTHAAMGDDKYFQYDAFSYNCQNFIYNLLKANDMGTQADYDWILQPVSELLKHEPGFLPGLTKTITNIGAIWGTLWGGGNLPSLSILQKIATESYSDSPKSVENWKVIEFTPTLKFYRQDNIVIVGIRGSIDYKDLKADIGIAVNNLKSSKRYKADIETMINFKYKYNAVPITYYGVGHSLGGAILDAFIAAGLIKKGVSFNPAVEPLNLRNDSYLTNRRIYITNDPLYLIEGRLAKGSEVMSGKEGFAHNLSNFEDIIGGNKKGGMEANEYNALLKKQTEAIMGKGHGQSVLSSETPKHEKGMRGYTFGERTPPPPITNKTEARIVLTNFSVATPADFRHYFGEDIRTFRELVKPSWKKILRFLHPDKGGTPEDREKMNTVELLVSATYGKDATITGSGMKGGGSFTKAMDSEINKMVYAILPDDRAQYTSAIDTIRNEAKTKLKQTYTHENLSISEVLAGDYSNNRTLALKQKIVKDAIQKVRDLLSTYPHKITYGKGSGHWRSREARIQPEIPARVMSHGRRVLRQDERDAQRNRSSRLIDRANIAYDSSYSSPMERHETRVHTMPTIHETYEPVEEDIHVDSGGMRLFKRKIFKSKSPKHEGIGHDETVDIDQAWAVPIGPEIHSWQVAIGPEEVEVPEYCPEPSAPPHNKWEIHAHNRYDPNEPQSYENILGGGEQNPTLKKEGKLFVIEYKGHIISKFKTKREAIAKLNTYSDKANRESLDKAIEEYPTRFRFYPIGENDLESMLGGKKLKHIKKYLKGMGIRATKGNIDKAMKACDAEGVVF